MEERNNKTHIANNTNKKSSPSGEGGAVSIVILNWNGAHMMRTYLPTVIQNTPEAEIIIADNASTDDSIKM